MKTRVFITIDTEFSIGGAFEAAQTRTPIGAQNVLCELAGRSEGLGFMLDTFAGFGLRATFFIEALQTAYFGDGPMGQISQRIAAAGHDLQLHLHPVWTYFDHPQWQDQLARQRPSDNMHGRSTEQLVGWMQRGIDTFARWGLPPPVALRTGNLMVDRNVYHAMAQVGLRVASNVARAVFEPQDVALQLNAGIHFIDRIAELPVLTYRDLQLARRARHKLLTITGSSFGETRHLLEQAHAAGAQSVVLLTHCHEFVKGDTRLARHADRVNQRRLRQLCQFLQQATDRFDVSTLGRMALLGPGAASTSDTMLRVPARLALWRMAQNKLNELNWV